MRNTKKRLNALDTYRKMGPLVSTATMSNDNLYDYLESQNYFWNSREGQWEKNAHKPSNSIFASDEGDATGVVRIRVMAHPDDVNTAVERIKKLAGLRIVDVSEKSYKNRKGAGVRIYITGLLV